MRQEKRRWIFEGLAVPPGVAAVSPVSSRVQLPRAPLSILLASDDERHLMGLGAPMRRMMARGWLVTAARIQALELPRVGELFAARPYNLALWLVSSVPAEVQRGCDELAKRRGIRNLWLGGVATFDHMTASDYAAWAARLWRDISRGNDG